MDLQRFTFKARKYTNNSPKGRTTRKTKVKITNKTKIPGTIKNQVSPHGTLEKLKKSKKTS